MIGLRWNGHRHGRGTSQFIISVNVLFSLGWSCLIGVRAVAAAEDPVHSSPAVVKKTKDGLHFNVPPDWPIEERNGAVGPIPIEEYMARKFSGIETRLRALEQQIGGMDVRLRVVEEDAKQARRTLKSSEQAAP